MKKEQVESLVKETIERAVAMCAAEVPVFPKQPKLLLGQSVLAITVTMYFTGRVVELDGDYIYLDHAAWIADTGRFHKAMKDGRDAFGEVEPCGADEIVRVARGACVAVIDWRHALPEGVK